MKIELLSNSPFKCRISGLAICTGLFVCLFVVLKPVNEAIFSAKVDLNTFTNIYILFLIIIITIILIMIIILIYL